MKPIGSCTTPPSTLFPVPAGDSDSSSTDDSECEVAIATIVKNRRLVGWEMENEALYYILKL